MIHLLLAIAVIATPARPDTVPASAESRASAFLDDGARVMVDAARSRRATAEAAILRYRNLATSRVSVGVSTFRRERMLYRCESAVRVDWQRDQPVRLEVLGAREVIPIVSAKVTPEDSDCSGAVFDPADDRLSLGTAGLLRGDTGFVRHPLGVGSEADYRFRSGDVTTLRLADGRVIRLRELQVLPRRSDSRLVSGSLWLEEESMAVVRALLRLARAFDLSRDGDEGDDEDVPGVLRPIRADLRYMTVEYGLWEGRWWLPRLIAVEGEVEAGRLIRLPLRVEQGYTGYEVWGDSASLPPASERLDLDPERCAPGRRRDRQAGSDSTSDAGTSSITVGTGGASVRVARRDCVCENGRCWRTERVVPEDTAQLLHSEHLPPSIFQAGDMIFTQREREELQQLLRRAAPAPWQVGAPQVRWGWQGLDLIRYNRVEGLSLGVQAEVDLGRAELDATGRLGHADRVPGVEVGLTSRRSRPSGGSPRITG
jgi:hypothetical protein